MSRAMEPLAASFLRSIDSQRRTSVMPYCLGGSGIWRAPPSSAQLSRA